MKTCYIVGAGEFEPRLFCPGPEDPVIAADGGYAHITNLGRAADFVVGDFDSLGSPPAHPRVLVARAEKDDTDMLLAVKHGLSLGCRRFVLLGGTGGRVDHTLANIQTLAFLSRRGARGYLAGGGAVMTAVTDGELRFGGGFAGLLSVFCLGDKAAGVYEEGLKYPLADATLTMDLPLGVSNEFTGRESRVAVAQGTLLLVWQGTMLPEDGE